MVHFFSAFSLSIFIISLPKIFQVKMNQFEAIMSVLQKRGMING